MNIGKKIYQLRVQNGLTQEELASRSELSKGFISQVERDLTSPSIATLVDILQGLGTNLNDFFTETEDEKVIFKRSDFYEKSFENDGRTIKWIVPNAKKNLMEPILVTLELGGKTHLDAPHEGEEFGYVLKGRIEIHLGTEVHKAKKGDSFYFNCSKKHIIINTGQTEAEFLWISTPPFF